jgi:hypothetical protein
MARQLRLLTARRRWAGDDLIALTVTYLWMDVGNS